MQDRANWSNLAYVKRLLLPYTPVCGKVANWYAGSCKLYKVLQRLLHRLLGLYYLHSLLLAVKENVLFTSEDFKGIEVGCYLLLLLCFLAGALFGWGAVWVYNHVSFSVHMH